MILVVMCNNQVINAADSERIHSCRNLRTVILFSAINNNGCCSVGNNAAISLADFENFNL